jgi:pimeloyl-ACP methyl ester carboxylesterase
MNPGPTMIMLPGYNEPPLHFNLLENGKGDIRGLAEYGFNCITFPHFNDNLRDRIDRLGDFIEELKSQGYAPPFTLLGYSLGGLVVRGYLRAYSARIANVSHAIMIASPNWGVETFVLPLITTMLRVPDHAMGDMNLDSPFMEWLNGTNGHWLFTHDRRHRIWTLDREPVVAPPNAKLLTIMGLIPGRGGDNDGLVWGDSATLASRIPVHFVIGPHANHMNIIGHFDPVVMLTKGFLRNDAVWPLTLRAILRFCGIATEPTTKASQQV